MIIHAVPTVLEYEKAVLRLVEMAKSKNGSSHIAAQALLSAQYDHGWFVSIKSLCYLDSESFSSVINVIIGGKYLYGSPMVVIENGKKVFEDLSRDWGHLKAFNTILN